MRIIKKSCRGHAIGELIHWKYFYYIRMVFIKLPKKCGTIPTGKRILNI
jgi:hypothetical protein